MMAESVPVTAEVLARALATLPKPPWYEAEPFKTLLAVVIGGFLTLAANWWLEHLELRARANSLKVAFRGEIGALRGSLRVEAKHARMTYEADGLLAGGVTYSRTVFEQNASHIGDLGDPMLVRQLTSFYALLARIENSRRLLAIGAPGREQFARHLGRARLGRQVVLSVGAGEPLRDSRGTRRRSTIVAGPHHESHNDQ